MITPKPITDEFAVYGQIAADDFASIAELGYKTVINNRPDHEESQQPTAADMASLANEQGLNYIHQPIVGGAMTLNDVMEFKQILDNAEGPVFAHCRSGTRCTHIWALANAGKIPTQEMVQRASAQGYDISGLTETINSLASQQ